MYCSSAAVRAGRRGSAVRWAVVGEEPMPASRLSAKATRQARLARTAPKISGLGRSSRFQLTGILAWSPMRAENRISIVLAKSLVKKRFDAVSAELMQRRVVQELCFQFQDRAALHW